MIRYTVAAAVALSLAILAVGTDALALDNIIRPYQSARGAGMGGLRITSGLYDENFFGNPARAAANPKWKVSLLDLTVETTPSTIDTIGDLAGGGDTLNKIADTAGTNNHGRIQTVFPAVYIPRLFGGKNSIAIGLIANTQFDVDLRRSYQLDPRSITDIGPAVTFARSFMNDRLAVGVTGHATYRLATREGYSFVDLIRGSSISPTQSGGQGAHIDFDVGSTYDLPIVIPGEVIISTAVSINHLLGGNYSNLGLELVDGMEGKPRPQPRSLGFGAAARKAQLWKFSDAMVGLEFLDIGNNPDGSLFRTVHLGGELRYGVLAPRLGINQGYFAGGLGINLKVLEIDLATYGEEMSLNVGGLQDRRYVAKIAIQI
jgi:hypothetical protein